MKYFRIMLALLFLFSSSSILLANEEIPVIGKAMINAGAVIEIGFFSGNGMERYSATAFEDQEVYIYKKVINPNTGITFYIAEGHGFVHDCPEHGREVLDAPGVAVLVVIHQVQIDSGMVTIEMFENI